MILLRKLDKDNVERRKKERLLKRMYLSRVCTIIVDLGANLLRILLYIGSRICLASRWL